MDEHRMKISRAVLVAAIVIVPVAAGAAPSDDLLAAMARCMAMTDTTARYACYDALAPQLKAAQSQPTPPPSPAETSDPRPWYDTDRIFGTSPSLQTKPEQFGAENLTRRTPPKPGAVAPAPPPLPEAIDSVTATVTSFAMNREGRFVVFLDNGQVWKQSDADADRAYFRKNGGERVVISRGLLGSYRLVVNDSGIAYRVKRVQ